jgi:hypothetical protein
MMSIWPSRAVKGDEADVSKMSVAMNLDLRVSLSRKRSYPSSKNCGWRSVA